MDLVVPLYSPGALSAVQRLPAYTPPPPFWLGFFPNSQYFEGREILFDKVTSGIERRLAPAVAPNMPGRMYREKSFETDRFRPAYYKPKAEVTVDDGFLRQPGEAIGYVPGGTGLSLSQRIQNKVVQHLATQRTLIQNRWEWMAAQMTQNGSCVVVGEDYPATTVDFRRDPSLTIVPGASAMWSQSGATPLEDIQHGRDLAYNLGFAPVSDIIFGKTAYALFAASAEVKGLLSNQVRLVTDTTTFDTLTLFNVGGATNVYKAGSITPNGGTPINLWVYYDVYEDVDGSLVPLLDPRDVIGIGANAKVGTKTFGAIQDLTSLVPTDIFPRDYLDTGDPVKRYIVSASAPLMVPSVVNNTFRIRVTA